MTVLIIVSILVVAVSGTIIANMRWSVTKTKKKTIAPGCTQTCRSKQSKIDIWV